VRQLQNRRPQSDSPKPNTGTASDQARATEFGTDVLTEESRRQANEAAEAMIPSLVERFLAMESANKRTRNQGASAGDQRMMRSSIDEGGRPSAGFREQTVPSPTSPYAGNPLSHQLAAYAAAIADKDYLRADFNSPAGAMLYDVPYTGDPVFNTEYFNYEFAPEDAISPESGKRNYFSSNISGQGNYWEKPFPKSYFPRPPMSSQFGPYTPFGIEGPQSVGRQPIAMGTPEGYYNPNMRRDFPHVTEINAARQAMADLANRYYDRAWAAGPSYMGGY
tara:strand:- start:4 stop:837 length:834 start_codon:yes stop_codon:yes gene_type:complete